VRKASESEPFSALASRSWPTRSASSPTSASTRAQINKGEEVYNSTKERKERLGRILLMHANQREDLEVAMAGDIVAGLGFKDTTTGRHALRPQPPDHPRAMIFPEPVIHVAIEPKTKDDSDKLGKALKSLSDEDPTFRVRTDEETGQTVISGMGELHLEILVDRMKREFNVDATVGKPQVAYRETITKTVESVEYRHIKQSGGSRPVRRREDHARAEPGQGLRVRRQDQRRCIPREYIPDQPGHAAGASTRACSPAYPTVDVKASLVDGSVPRRRLVGDGVQDRRSDGVQEGRRDGQAGAARADHGSRW
jgi:elongation factor G